MHRGASHAATASRGRKKSVEEVIDWTSVIAGVCADLCVAWDVAAELTIPRLCALIDQWNMYPPPRVSMAIMAGTVGKSSKQQTRMDSETVNSVFGGGNELSCDEFDEMLSGWGIKIGE